MSGLYLIEVLVKKYLEILCVYVCLYSGVAQGSDGCEGAFSDQAQPISVIRDKVWQSIYQVLESKTAQKYLTEDAVEILEGIFDQHENWFYDPANLASFEKRLSRFGNKVFPFLTESILETNAEYSINQSILFSLIVRGTIKDWLWKHSAVGRARLESAGVDPLTLMNLSDPKLVSSVLKHVTSENNTLVKKQSLDDGLMLLTGHSRDEVLESEHLQNIFADEISEALKPSLTKIIKNNSPDSAKRLLAQELYDQLNGDPDELQMVLVPRRLESFKNGGCSGDCTKPGRENYWTVGSWMGTFENIELHLYHGKVFFGRMVVVLGFSNNEATAYVHAFEFAPKLQNPKSKLYKDRIDYFSRFLRKAQKFFTRAGIKKLIVTRISNSSEYADSLQNIVHSAGIKTSSPRQHVFEILTRQETSHNILRQELGEKKVGIPIYLQGWSGPFNFSYKNNNTSKLVDTTVSLSGGNKVERLEVQRASHIILAYVHENQDVMKRKIDPILTRLYDVHSQGDQDSLSRQEFFEMSKSVLLSLDKITSSPSRKTFIKNMSNFEATLTFLEEERRSLDDAFNPSGVDIDHHIFDDMNVEMKLAVKKAHFMFSSTEHQDILRTKLHSAGFVANDIDAMMQDLTSVMPYAAVQADNLELTSDQSSLVDGVEILAPSE